MAEPDRDPPAELWTMPEPMRPYFTDYARRIVEDAVREGYVPDPRLHGPGMCIPDVPAQGRDGIVLACAHHDANHVVSANDAERIVYALSGSWIDHEPANGEVPETAICPLELLRSARDGERYLEHVDAMIAMRLRIATRGVADVRPADSPVQPAGPGTGGEFVFVLHKRERR
jgi:hypothetical protein